MVDKKEASMVEKSSDKAVISTEAQRSGETPVLASSSDTAITALIAANAQAAADAAILRDELATTQAQLATVRQSNTTLNAQLDTLRRALTEGNDTLDAQAPPVAIRHRLPAERASITHKFSVGGHEGYVTVGLYPNGQPGEIFVRMAKEGSTISGLMDSFATAASLCLQHGVPLKVLVDKFAHTRFEPSGWTGDENIGYAKSLMDYLFRWMQLRFLSGHQLSLFNLKTLQPQNAQPSLLPGAPSNAVILSEARNTSSDAVILSGAQRAESKNPDTAGSTTGVGAFSTPNTVPVTGTVNAPDNTVLYESHGSSAEQLNDRRAPQQGIAPDLTARSGIDPSSRPSEASGETPVFGVQDRGLYHAATAMKAMYEMGDAPSCSTCGAIMTRNGSCYRCMECGSTSGCS
jgi:ribonucleoside-diphosphate reductase alpha chain